MYSWGEGARGQLAQHLQGDDGGALLLEPRAAALSLGPAQVLQQVACGQEHTVVLDADGKVWTCGRNSAGQLGRRKDKDRTAPGAVKGLSAIVGVACGQDHCLALCESGRVFAWGRGSEGQLGIRNFENHIIKPREVSTPRLQCMPIPIVQVACGNQHSLALTVGGDVYSWGVNRFGQLGHPKEVSTLAIPSRIQSLTGVPVTQICAGGEHSLVLGLSGLVYCCGANGSGQLGLNRVDEKGRFNVCVVPALRELSISSISCGEAHTAVLTQDGSVFTFGEGSYGQLGHNSTANELRPRRVESLEGQAAQIACGSHHTLVLMSSGLLLAFGSGLKGQLGNGDTDGRLVPSPVRATWRHEGAAGHSDMKISAGWNTSIIHCVPPMNGEKKEKCYKISDKKLQKWMTLKSGSKELEEAKREISLILSSSSSLVANFLRKKDPTSGDTPGTAFVDLQAARRSFEQMQAIPWISPLMNAVGELVTDVLSASLYMRSVDIFLVLPELPLLHEDQSIINIVLNLAKAIIQLPDSSQKQLKQLWSLLEPEVVKKHIRMWKCAVSFILCCGLLQQFNKSVADVLQIMKYLYKARKALVDASEFYLEDLNFFPGLLLQDLCLWRGWKKLEDNSAPPAIFCRFPFVLNLSSKIQIFNFAAEISKNDHQQQIMNQARLLQLGIYPSELPPCPVFKLQLRPQELLEDTFRKLSIADHENFKKDLVVVFTDSLESSFLDRMDFFLLIFQQLIVPGSGVFTQNEAGTVVWFPVRPTEPNKRYFLIGVLCGLAVYNNNMVYLPFPLALFKKLLNVKPTLEDLKELSPVVAESLNKILAIDSDMEMEDMGLTFCVSWDDVTVELDPKEKGKPVTIKNKQDFVNAYVDYILNTSVEATFEEFRRGFFTVCDMDVVELFQPQELMELMVGNENYEWDKFRQNTIYEDEYHAGHPNIIRFWDVFEEMTQDQKKSFFWFVTGDRRVPILGMDQIKMKVKVKLQSTDDHYPGALICHHLLWLPIYETKEGLKTKLIEAINHKKDYWKDMAAATSPNP
ncbi:probable E3 ubiquitin-protein ligase HERC6 [Scleropages formosus]|uniref:probable E3 ubiquitin-protein ligase HERC6 n=1 Tax=Scleropages formosus TaxID=113540 RepID=UPI0010FA7FCA|nr:probable E3 ubiquitin-protein ligase HERC6 [Scleropages formosus]